MFDYDYDYSDIQFREDGYEELALAHYTPEQIIYGADEPWVIRIALDNSGRRVDEVIVEFYDPEYTRRFFCEFFLDDFMCESGENFGCQPGENVRLERTTGIYMASNLSAYDADCIREWVDEVRATW